MIEMKETRLCNVNMFVTTKAGMGAEARRLRSQDVPASSARHC